MFIDRRVPLLILEYVHDSGTQASEHAMKRVRVHEMARYFETHPRFSLLYRDLARYTYNMSEMGYIYTGETTEVVDVHGKKTSKDVWYHSLTQKGLDFVKNANRNEGKKEESLVLHSWFK